MVNVTHPVSQHRGVVWVDHSRCIMFSPVMSLRGRQVCKPAPSAGHPWRWSCPKPLSRLCAAAVSGMSASSIRLPPLCGQVPPIGCGPGDHPVSLVQAVFTSGVRRSWARSEGPVSKVFTSLALRLAVLKALGVTPGSWLVLKSKY